MSLERPQAIDPVCGMTVIPEKAAGSFDYQGMRYYFCGLSCLRRFEADPEQFVRRAAVAAPPRAGTLYVCPMDPEIHQDHPGFCPKCGVALEPLNITFEDAPNPELVDMSRRFRMAALLGAPAFVLAMGEMVFGMGLGGRINPRITNWIGLASATPVVLGRLAFLRARLGVDRQPQPEHVHGDRSRRWRGISLQRGRHHCAGPFSRRLPDARCRRNLFRHSGRDHRSGIAWTGARTARARPHEFSAAPAPWAGSDDGARYSPRS